MQFIDRRRTRPAVPLVSLIDILTILLVFFIVTAQFREAKSVTSEEVGEESRPAEERRLEISLPGIREMEGQPVEETRVPIGLTAEGGILLDGAMVEDAESLVAALKARKAADPEALFELEPDERVPLGRVLEVWEALVRAGIPVGEVPARVLRED